MRVRRAIAAAIDHQDRHQAAADGLGVPIGSHYVPGAFGCVDTTGMKTPTTWTRRKGADRRAGVKTTTPQLTLPPRPTHARAARSSPPNWPKSASP